ncbi:MAG: LuxR C-terminal-related transcriptional regulator [Candidatus Limnocylindrales bacterium]
MKASSFGSASVAPGVPVFDPDTDAGRPHASHLQAELASRRGYQVLSEARLRAPEAPAGHIARPAMVRRFSRASQAVITVVSGPTGYGKTSALAEFARKATQPVAWLTVDRDLDRAEVLIHYLGAALDRVALVDREPFLPPDDREGAADRSLAILTNSLAAVGQEFALVVDDAHLLRSTGALKALAAVCQAIPAGSRVLLATRGAAPVPIAALRLGSGVHEIGPDDLAFDLDEACRLFARAGIRLATETVDHLVDRTEGWPAGLALAVRSLRGAADLERAARTWTLGDYRAAEYLREHLLADLDPDLRAFLVDASVLGRFSRGLAGVALGGSEAQDAFDRARHEGQFLVPLDERHEWFRFTRPFAELLGDEAALTIGAPGISTIHQRAALAEELNGHYVSAVAHANAARDDGLTTELLERGAFRMEREQGIGPVLEAVAALPAHRLSAAPDLAITAAMLAAFGGSAAEARRYLLVAENAPVDRVDTRSGRSLAARVLVVRGLLGMAGISGMRSLAIEALGLDPGEGPWRGVVEFLHGASQGLLGHTEVAMARLDQARRWLTPVDPSRATFATGYLALTALAAGDPDTADTAARSALEQADGLPPADRAGATAAAHAAAGVVAARRGHVTEARERLHAGVAAVEASDGLPWWSIQLRIELARLAMSVDELGLAGTLVPAARRRLLRLRDAGTLPQSLVETERALVLARRGEHMLREPLTEAEWRVLDLLQTHLPIPEISDRLFVSRNTTKTHVKALYEKLDAHSRTEAIERAFALKLLQAPPTG